MKTPASIARHPIHPMLIPIPLGLFIFSLVCDLFALAPGASDDWETVAYFAMAGGVIGALIAAVPGIIDMLSLPSAPKRVALWHMAINLTVVVLYLVNLWLRSHEDPSLLPLWLSLAAVGLLGISGWLGGKLVYEHAVGVSRPSEQDGY